MSCNDEGFEIFNLFAGRLDIRIKNCLRYVRMYIRCQLGLFMHGKFFDTYLCTFFTASNTKKILGIDRRGTKYEFIKESKSRFP